MGGRSGEGGGGKEIEDFNPHLRIGPTLGGRSGGDGGGKEENLTCVFFKPLKFTVCFCFFN